MMGNISMKMQIQTISPEAAATMLGSNTDNRRLRKWWVRVLIGRLARGEWCLSHQGIAFDERGILRDGQHRLHAVVESGIPAQMAVFTDVPAAAFKVMDQGIKRNMSDLLGLDRRITDPCSLAASISFGNSFSFDQIEPIVSSRIGDYAINLIDLCGASTKFYTSAPMKLSCIMSAILAGDNGQYAFSVYQALARLDFENMPKVAQSLVRQVQTGKASAGCGNSRGDTIARGLKVFDRNKADLQKIQIDDDATAEAIAYVRAFISSEIARSERQAA